MEYLKEDIEMNINDICFEFQRLIKHTFNLELCKSVTSLDSNVPNFINIGINKELDDCVNTYNKSNNKLESIRMKLDEIILNGEKKQKNDFVKYMKLIKMEFLSNALVEGLKFWKKNYKKLVRTKFL